jgi:hypothetical protein
MLFPANGGCSLPAVSFPVSEEDQRVAKNWVNGKNVLVFLG